MDIAPMNVHGWKLHLANDQLWIGSEEDPDVHIKMGAEAAYSLLDYLYRYRDDLHDAADREKAAQMEERRAAQKESQAEVSGPPAGSE
jgi:hypothetical protein